MLSLRTVRLLVDGCRRAATVLYEQHAFKQALAGGWVGGGGFGVGRAGCFSKGTAGQISALNDDPHSSCNLVQSLLKIGARCPREEKQIPK